MNNVNVVDLYLYIRDSFGDESIVEGSHGSDKAENHVTVAPVEDFAANEYVIDFGLRMKRFDFVDNPLTSKVDVFERYDVAVGGGDGEGDAGVGEGPDDFWVHIEDLDAVDGCPCLEKVGHRGRRREVVADGSIVDADGVRGGSELQE